MPNRAMSTTIFTVACAALLATTAALAQGPSTFDKKTIYTFSGPVELPRVALQPGQYIFRLADPETTRKILQVVSADGKQVYGNFFWIPLERAEVKAGPEVRLMEATAGAPPAIRAVWYPGERTGWELIYPRQQAMRIARHVADPVLTTKADSSKTDETATDELARVSSSGQDVAPSARTDAPESVGTSGRADAEPVAQTPARPEPPAQPERETLPQTASPQMLIGIVSLCLLGAAGALRMWRGRVHRVSTGSE